MTEISDAKPDVKTFDLGAVLAGRGYPETEVTVYFDEATGLAISEANEKLSELAGLAATDSSGKRSKEYDSLEAELAKMVASLSERKFTIKIKGTPPKVKQDILRQVDAKFPAKRDAFGREDFDQSREDEFQRLMWATHIVRIIDPSGAEITPTEDDVKDLRDLAPLADQLSISQGIAHVGEAGKGFSIAARDVDFLSKP